MNIFVAQCASVADVEAEQDDPSIRGVQPIVALSIMASPQFMAVHVNEFNVPIEDPKNAWVYGLLDDVARDYVETFESEDQPRTTWSSVEHCDPKHGRENWVWRLTDDADGQVVAMLVIQRVECSQ